MKEELRIKKQEKDEEKAGPQINTDFHRLKQAH
jgi:hypothetical protein